MYRSTCAAVESIVHVSGRRNIGSTLREQNRMIPSWIQTEKAGNRNSDALKAPVDVEPVISKIGRVIAVHLSTCNSLTPVLIPVIENYFEEVSVWYLLEFGRRYIATLSSSRLV
jgi:hypothetical protein